MPTPLRLILLLFCLLPLGGCVTAAAPRLHPVSLAAAQQSEEAIVLVYGIEATNQARVDLPLVEVQYQLRLDGETVYLGRRALQQTIPLGHSTRLQIPVVINFQAVPDALSEEWSLDLTGTLYFIKPGQLARALFDQGLVRPTTNFSWQHVVDVRALAEQPLSLQE